MAPHQPHIIEDCNEDPASSSRQEEEKIHCHHQSLGFDRVLIGRSVLVRQDIRPVSPLSMFPFQEEEHPAIVSIHSCARSNENKEEADPTTSATTTTSSMIQKRQLNHQQSFLLFVKVYSLYLCQVGGDEKKLLLRKFKAVVSKCTTENRKGNPEYMPLQQVVQKKLRNELGHVHWTTALYIFRVYCKQRQIQVDPLFS